MKYKNRLKESIDVYLKNKNGVKLIERTKFLKGLTIIVDLDGYLVRFFISRLTD